MIIDIIKKKIGEYKLRKLKKSLAYCGSNFNCVFPITIIRPETLVIGNNVFISNFSHISSCKGCKIGNNVMIGPSVIIESNDHVFGIIGKTMYETRKIKKEEPFIIEDNVWIGAHVTILKGVTIGEGSVIGAGSVVVKDIPPYTVNVGNPSRPVKKIFSDEELFVHLTKLGKVEEEIKKIISVRNNMLKEKSN